MDSNLPEMHVGWILPFGPALGYEFLAAEQIDHNALPAMDPVLDASTEYGGYLVTN